MKAIDCIERFCRDELGLVGTVPLHAPDIQEPDVQLVSDCLKSGWVSSVGKFVDEFERLTAQACGTKFAIAAVNGTAALHAALHTIGVQTDDLVLCPALTFIATANAISYCGADPLFIDSSPETLCIDVDKLRIFLSRQCDRRFGKLFDKRSGRRISALIVVHIFGHSAQMTELLALAESFDLPVVEDAAEALGSKYRGHPCGSLGRIGVISFNGNKIITTGGGGMVVTNDEVLAQRVRHITTTARTGRGGIFDHDEVGFNYRMPNINAAFGCAQISRLEDYVARKRRLAERYRTLFAECNEASFHVDHPWDSSNYWLNLLRFHDSESRDAFLRDTAIRKIETRPCWRLLSDTKAYVNAPRADELAGARYIESCSVNIPSGPALIRSPRPS